MKVDGGGFLRRLAYVRETRAIHFLALLLALFLALSLVVHSPQLRHLDQAISQAAQRYQSDTSVWVARSVSHTGDMLTLAVLGTGAAVAFYRRKRPWAALLCAVTLLGHPLNLLLKQLYGKSRPDEEIVSVLLPAVGLSFPSGHAMASAWFFGFLALMAWIHLPQRRSRLFWTVTPAALVVAIGWARIYVGAHWFSDVIGGWTAGLFLLLVVAEVYKAVGAKEIEPACPSPPLPSAPVSHQPAARSRSGFPADRP